MRSKNSALASSGLVVTRPPEDFGGRDRESCLGFVRHLEQAAFRAGGGDYAAPAQRLVDFARGVASARLPASSYALGIRPARLDELLPAFVAGPLRRALGDFDETLAGYLHPEAVAHGVESRASSPLRIPRDPRTGLATGPDGIYPAGEGAGWAGGITSAALDGLLAAAKIVARHQRPG